MADRSPQWLSQHDLTTDVEQLREVDQHVFLDGLKRWAAEFLGLKLSNDLGAELTLVPRNIYEAWRTDPTAATHREMPVHRRLLLVYRLLEKRTDRASPKRPRWSAEEEQKLRELWGTMPHAEIAKALNRNPKAIAFKARKLGLEFRPAVPEFSAEDLQVIAAEYRQLGSVELGRRLCRSPQAIRMKASKLGVAGRPGRRPAANNQKAPH